MKRVAIALLDIFGTATSILIEFLSSFSFERHFGFTLISDAPKSGRQPPFQHSDLGEHGNVYLLDRLVRKRRH